VRERRAFRQGYVLGHSGWSGSSWKAWTSTRASRPSWCRCGPGRSYGEARKATKRRCGRCGKRCAGYDQGADRRRWRTLDLGLIRAFLEADAPQVLERRRMPADHSRSLPATELERVFTRRDVPLRERALWRLLYETAARAEEVLSLNIEDLNLPARRAVTLGKGGDREVLHFATGSARLLPRLLEGRTGGPVFLADRPSAPSRAPALADLDPLTGRARLSYRRAAELFTSATGGAKLHQLRHASLTHVAEAGVPTVLLMAKSRHASLRSLQRYARPGVEAVAQLTADHDPARRRRR